MCSVLKPGFEQNLVDLVQHKKLTITENIILSELDNDKYFYGVFPNNYGVQKQPSEVFVNIDGMLKKATAVYANVDGTLKQVPMLLSAEIKTDSETMKLYKFTPTTGGNYTIKVNRKSGDHEIRLYDGNFKPMTDSYFYSQSFALTAVSVFYISVTHYYEQIQARALCRFLRRTNLLWRN